MKNENSITANVSFDYKAKNYQISANLDACMLANTNQEQVFDMIYLQLAKQNNIDTYSYEFEILQSSEIVFSNAKGFIKECLNDGILDISKVRTAYIMYELKQISNKHGLEFCDKLQNALQDAYKLGINNQKLI